MPDAFADMGVYWVLHETLRSMVTVPCPIQASFVPFLTEVPFSTEYLSIVKKPVFLDMSNYTVVEENGGAGCLSRYGIVKSRSLAFYAISILHCKMIQSSAQSLRFAKNASEGLAS
jgi:hypothetical protein